MASCDVKLEGNQNKIRSTPPRCWKNQNSSFKKIQVDLTHSKHLIQNPRLFKLMFQRWNKHSKWAIRKVRSYLSCLQLGRSRIIYIELWRFLRSIMDLRRTTNLKNFSRWTWTFVDYLTRCYMHGMTTTCFKPSCLI
jgi:hypothetical protein